MLGRGPGVPHLLKKTQTNGSATGPGIGIRKEANANKHLWGENGITALKTILSVAAAQRSSSQASPHYRHTSGSPPQPPRNLISLLEIRPGSTEESAVHTAVSKAITEEQEFLPAHQPQLFPFPTVDVTFHRLEQDVQIKLGVAAKEEAGAGAGVGVRWWWVGVNT